MIGNYIFIWVNIDAPKSIVTMGITVSFSRNVLYIALYMPPLSS